MINSAIDIIDTIEWYYMMVGLGAFSNHEDGRLFAQRIIDLAPGDLIVHEKPDKSCLMIIKNKDNPNEFTIATIGYFIDSNIYADKLMESFSKNKK